MSAAPTAHSERGAPAPAQLPPSLPCLRAPPSTPTGAAAWRPCRTGAARGPIALSHVRRTVNFTNSSSSTSSSTPGTPDSVPASPATPLPPPTLPCASLPPPTPQPLQPSQPAKTTTAATTGVTETGPANRELRRGSPELEKARAHLRALVAQNPEIQTKSASAEMLGVGACPRWVPDTACDACMYCHRRFAVLFRRHHCRKCGALLCGVCTGYKLDLPELLFTKPVRVCVLCYVSYKEGKMDSVFFEESGVRATGPPALPTSSTPSNNIGTTVAFPPQQQQQPAGSGASELSCSDTVSDCGGTASIYMDEDEDEDEGSDESENEEESGGGQTGAPEGVLARRRLRLVRETVLAEQLYADELATVCAVLVGPVRVTGLALPAPLGALLADAAELERVHRALLQRLTDDAATQNGRVLGACFEALAAHMDVYARYCTRLPDALCVLDALQHGTPANTSSSTSSTNSTSSTGSNSELGRVLAACEADPRARGQSLAGLLARPAQRALRYPALVADVLALTPPAHADHAALERAAARLDAALAPVREQRRRADAHAQLARLAAAVTGALPADLAAPGRTLVAQHALAVTDVHRGGSPYPGVLFVLSDALLVCRDRTSASSSSSSSSSSSGSSGTSSEDGRPYEVRGWVPVSEAHVVVFAEAPATPHCFEVARGRDGVETYRFFARDAAQKDAVVRTVKGLVNACRRGQLAARTVSLRTLAPADAPADTLAISSPTQLHAGGSGAAGAPPTAPETPLQPLCMRTDTATPDDYAVALGTPAVVTAMPAHRTPAPPPPVPRHWQPHCLRALPPPAWLQENTQALSFAPV